jgi:hypothetical protein
VAREPRAAGLAARHAYLIPALRARALVHAPSDGGAFSRPFGVKPSPQLNSLPPSSAYGSGGCSCQVSSVFVREMLVPERLLGII